MDLNCCLEKAAKYNDIKKVMEQALKGPLKGILDYTDEQIVPCCFNSDTTLPSSMLGLALLSMTTVSNSYHGMTMEILKYLALDTCIVLM